MAQRSRFSIVSVLRLFPQNIFASQDPDLPSRDQMALLLWVLTNGRGLPLLRSLRGLPAGVRMSFYFCRRQQLTASS
jgi:hypothetical protein